MPYVEGTIEICIFCEYALSWMIYDGIEEYIRVPIKGLDDLQGSHGQGKVREKCKKFKVMEKSGNFEISQGNLKKTAKVREKSGNFRIRKKF